METLAIPPGGCSLQPIARINVVEANDTIGVVSPSIYGACVRGKGD